MRLIWVLLLVGAITGCTNCQTPDPNMALPEVISLRAKLKPRHLQFKIWCYADGVCAANAWPEGEAFSYRQSIEWIVTDRGGVAVVAKELSEEIDKEPRQQTGHGPKTYNSGEQK